jgi:hypothetical protein
MLLMVFAGQFHKIKERHWFQEDTIMRMDPEFPAMSPYEHRLAKQMRKETIEILGLQPVNGVLPD